jgi:hypothetical protein
VRLLGVEEEMVDGGVARVGGSSGELAAVVAGSRPLGGVWRVAPLQGEMTQSFLARLAARYGLELRYLVAAIADVGGSPNVMGRARPDSEVFLSEEARQRVASLCRVPEQHLRLALPAWTQEEPRKRLAAGPAAQFHHGPEKVLRWGPACPECTMRRAGRAEAARLYLGPQERVCRLHRRWLMHVPGLAGRVVDLAGGGQWWEAQRRHVGLLRRSALAADAFEVAEAVTASWWWQVWPQEHVWPSRLRSFGAKGLERAAWRVVARELVTYPETVALAGLLADEGMRRRVVAKARGCVPFRLADLPVLLSAVARCLKRPWLAESLAPVTSGPLFAWAYQYVRAQGSAGAEGRAMWVVAPAHRPRCLVDELADRAQPRPGKRRRGHSRQSDEAFSAGLAAARRYVLEHGNLAVQKDTRVGPFRLGDWLHNVKTRVWALSTERAQELAALDPWWNVPWPTQWQRSYYRARDHAAVNGLPDAAAGFPGTQVLNGEWLYLQCTRYSTLHPEQQRLLADLGITAEVAEAARPRRASLRAGFETALAHARAYAAEHGHLAVAGKGVVYQGYPLGAWLNGQRAQARRATRSTDRSRALDAVDPWWNPPWALSWQRNYVQARRLVEGGFLLDVERGFPEADAELALWLSQQCALFRGLHRDQRRLLAGIGIMAKEADEVQTASEGADKLRNGTVTRLDTSSGLISARSFAAVHGHLAVASDCVHDGYPLGAWLAKQRGQERRHLRGNGSAWPRGQLLAELDPWWNPPWHYPWQRHYQQARKRWQEGRLRLPGQQHSPTEHQDEDEDALMVWLGRQCARHDALRPEQQNLLAEIGISAATARTVVTATARPSPGETVPAQARNYAAEYGHLAVTERTRHNGYPLGGWLLRQRHRAAQGRSDPARIAALNAIDPHWNPPWPLSWQRAYHQARAATDGGNLNKAQLRWINTQTRLWDSLHPVQQQLLADIGAAGPLSVPARSTTTRRYPLGEGLPHARAYAAKYGHLAVFTHAQHDGFSLGRWLIQQRRKARAGLLSARTLQELTVLDPWWNPPWPFTWQRNYQQYRIALARGRLSSELDRWARKQTTLWDQLHPHQQTLLRAIGLHTPHSR